MQSFWLEFLTKQVPVIVVLGFFCFGMYKYFIAVIEKKDVLLDNKDAQIKELHEKLMAAFIKNTEAYLKNADALSDLKDQIRK